MTEDDSNADPLERLLGGMVIAFDQIRDQICDEAGMPYAMLGVVMIAYGADLINQTSGLDAAVHQLNTEAASIRAENSGSAGSC